MSNGAPSVPPTPRHYARRIYRLFVASRQHLARRIPLVCIAGVVVVAAGYGAPRIQWGTAADLGTDSVAQESSSTAGTDTVPLFGPQRFDGVGGGVAIYVERFIVATSYDGYTLRAQNGEIVGEMENGDPVYDGQVDSAEVRLNGQRIFGSADFRTGDFLLHRPVEILGEDTLEVAIWQSNEEYVWPPSLTLSLLATPDPTFTFYGPVRVDITRNNETVGISDTFPLPPDAAPPYRVHVINGAEDGTSRIKDGYLNINGTPVLTSDDINEAIAAAVREGPFTDTTYYTTVVKRSPAGSHMVFRFTATDSTPPVVAITSPTDGLVTSTLEVQVDGTLQDRTTTRVSVNGFEAGVTNNESFGVLVPLEVEGENVLVALATDAAGNQGGDTIRVTRDTEAPLLSVTEPAENIITNADSVTVAGSVQDLTTVSVGVNGIPVTLDPAGAFSTRIALVEGENFITVSATDAAGNGTSLTRLVTRDTAPPALTVTEPVDGASTTSDSITVAGTVSDATPTTVSANGIGLSVAADGSFRGMLPLIEGSNAIVTTATDAAGNSSVDSRTVTRTSDVSLPPDPATVAPPVDPTITTSMAAAVSFLYEGEAPIQTGVAAGAIDPVRVAVARGRVLTRDGQPLSGVTVSVADHPELGQTLSRADGWYDLALNGGATARLVYAKSGYLRAERKVAAAWQRFDVLDDVVLVAPDPNVTTIDFSEPVEVARGSTETDAAGTRKATLLFEQGTSATMVLPDGTEQVLTSLSVRATEYTVGEAGPNAMPAELPAATGYTYAVEFSADEAIAAGASTVRFSKPIINYTENFIGFPVGTSVPTAYYDPDLGSWVPSSDGRVLAILETSGGLAEVDLDGDGVAEEGATLASFGITDAERTTLASLYSPGQSLWRVLIPHFTPWDHNWPYGPPEGVVQPNQNDPQPGDKLCEKGDSCRDGSIILAESQALGERLAIEGTAFSMSYSTLWQDGRTASRSLSIPLTDAAPPASLDQVHVSVQVAGRTFKQSYASMPSLVHEFFWDGRDAYGRLLSGKQPVTVEIVYDFPAVYQETSEEFEASFGSLSGVPLQTNSTRTRFYTNQTWTGMVGTGGVSGGALGGWRLDQLHSYDTHSGVVYAGDGRRWGAENAQMAINTVAGTGAYGYGGDGGTATAALFADPRAVAIDPHGGYYVADMSNHRIRYISPAGVITTFAGNGEACPVGDDPCGDGGPATDARLLNPSDIDIDAAGNLYISDDYQVRRVSPDGIITTVAGTGYDYWSSPYGYGEEVPATQATLGWVVAIAVQPDGTLYIADLGYNTIRRVDLDGIIRTVAGDTTTYGFSEDGTPAKDALIDGHYGIDVAGDGTIYFSEFFNKRVRSIAPDGILRTVAGTGERSGEIGDGGPATLAVVHPSAVEVGPDGLYILSERYNRIRRIDESGIITTVAGSSRGFSGDNGPATAAQLSYPGIGFAPDGNMYLADGANYRIRRVAPPFSGFDAAEIAVAAPDGSEIYRFDPNGRHLGTIDARTGAIRLAFGYGPEGLLTSVTDQDGLATTIERDGSGVATAVIGPYGQRTTLGHDNAGRLESISNPAGEATVLGYDTVGLLSVLTDPRGNSHGFAYDSLGRLTRDTDPAGGFQELVRTDSGGVQEVAVSTALGRTHTYIIDRLATGDVRRSTVAPDGLTSEMLIGATGVTTYSRPDGTRITSGESGDPRWGMQAAVSDSIIVTTPGGITSRTKLRRTTVLTDPDNPFSLTSETDSVVINGRTAVTVYDASLPEYASTSPEGRVSRTRVDSVGRVLEGRVSGLDAVNYAYNAQGQLTSVSQGMRNWSYSYDSAGLLQSTTDPLLRTDSLFYDLAGRVTRQVLHDGNQITYTYDANGNLTSLAPPGRPAHLFHYDVLDLDSIYDPPEVGLTEDRTQYFYNLDRDLTRILRPDGLSIDFAYDSAGRVDSITAPRGVVGYAYSATTGQLAGITAPGGEALSFAYDGFLQTAESWSGTVSGSVGFGYDTDFRVAALTVNGADTVRYGYDGDGLLTAAGALALARDADHGLLRSTALDSLTTRQSYNTVGEVVTDSAWYGATLVFARTYTRDDLGRITGVEDFADGLITTWGYGYDQAGRLETVTRDGASYASYEYDANGNRLSRTTPSGVETGVYDDQDRLVSYAGAEYRYTANGELATKVEGSDTTRYTYDVFGNLTRVDLPDGSVIEYVIDGRNRRVGKKVDGVLVQGFLYGDQLNPVAELDGSGNVISRFVYGSKANVPDYVVRGGETFRLISDHLGSARMVVNVATGVVVQKLSYDAWGRVLEDTNPGWQPLGFAGGLWEGGTGLVRFGARDYLPETGRWSAKDQILFHGRDANLYGYSASDPANLTDPTGRIVPAAILVGGVLGGTFNAIAVDRAGGSGWAVAGAFVSGAFAGAATAASPLNLGTRALAASGARTAYGFGAGFLNSLATDVFFGCGPNWKRAFTAGAISGAAAGAGAAAGVRIHPTNAAPLTTRPFVSYVGGMGAGLGNLLAGG